jgi:hypothetical protein
MGTRVMSQWIVCEWIERFKNGRTNVKHGEGTRSQSTSITDADVEQVLWHDQQNGQVTADEVAHQLQIIHGSACEIIHNRLVFHRICA